MSDIAEWLLAQYDADEQRAEDLHDRRTCDMYSYDPKCCDCDYPDELRDDLVAKRRTVELHELVGSDLYPEEGLLWCATCSPRTMGPCQTVRLLALPYADCDGYDERWRPEQ